MMLHYLKFLLIHVVGLVALIAILAGGAWMVAGLIGISLFFIVGDAILGDDTSEPKIEQAAVMTFFLWLALPLLVLIVAAFIWSVSPGDAGGVGVYLSEWVGYDLIAAKNSTSFGQQVAGVILMGLMIGLIGTVTAHELTHRTWDPVSMVIGRWLLAFSYDTIFSIEHVYGHHRYVATESDPATAPRGRNVYTHILMSTIQGNVSAWKIEKRRLKRRGFALFSWHNAVLRGHGMSLLLTIAAFGLGGFVGMLFFIVCGLWGKALLEIVNYMEHYGIVRDGTTPVQTRHSWNTNKKITSWAMFNLCRHSHHHAQGEVPFHDLKPFPEAPTMIGGYLTTIIVALIPPLWHKLMTPKVLEWDQRFASETERQLAVQANKKSGLKAFAL
jgi:alkane 1-monooxygenase